MINPEGIELAKEFLRVAYTRLSVRADRAVARITQQWESHDSRENSPLSGPPSWAGAVR